jgi:uncharacterized membrane protein
VNGQVIARCGGFELLEDGPRLIFVDRGTSWFGVALFVVGLLAFITSGNGVLWVVLSIGGNRDALVPALILLPLGALFVTAFVLLWKAKARRAKDPAPTPDQVLMIADRAQNALTDAAGRPFAPLDGAVFRSAMQLGSSSSCLEVGFAGGTRVIARGSPFSGSIDDMQDALRARGLRVA